MEVLLNSVNITLCALSIIAIGLRFYWMEQFARKSHMAQKAVQVASALVPYAVVVALNYDSAKWVTLIITMLSMTAITGVCIWAALNAYNNLKMYKMAIRINHKTPERSKPRNLNNG